MYQFGAHDLKRIVAGFLLASLLALSACSSPEEKAQAHLESGQELLAKNDYVKAGLEFRNAVKFNDKLVEGWVGLSKVEEQAQNWSGVNSTLTKVLELDPDHFESLVRIGKLQLIAGNVDTALEYINKAYDQKSDNSDVLAARAAVLLRLNDREGARRDGERALALDTENTDAYAVLATERIADGDLKNGLLFIDRGLAADERDLALLLLKVRAFEQQKDDVQLEATLRQLLSFYPDQVAFRRALMSMMLDRKRFDDAETEMRALVANDPDNPAAALELVRFMGRLKGPASARTELLRLRKEFPQKIDYSLALAEFDFGQGEIDDAKAQLKAIIDKGEPEEDIRRSRILLARMHLSQKEVETASKLIADVLAADEKNADALALRAAIRLDANDTENAITDLREALGQQPRSVPLLRLLGKALERQGAVELAEERFGQAVSVANYQAGITLEFVSFLIRRGKLDKAEQILTDAVGRHSNDRRLLTSLARLRLNKQDWAGAEQISQILKKLGDQGGVSDQILGAAQLGQQKFDQSAETFKTVFAQSQGAGRPMLGATMAYVRAGKLDEAEKFVSSVLQANADNAEARVLMGALKEFQQKPEEAVSAYEKAIERQPGNAAGYRALARYHVKARNLDEAETVLKTGRDKTSGDFSLSLELSSILEFKRDIDGAIAIYEELLVSRPNALVVANNLASLLADYRDDEASLARANELTFLLKSTDLPHFKDTLGWVAYRRGNYQAALGYLQEAVKKLPELNLVRYHLAMTHRALEQSAKARAEFAKALDLTKEGDPLREKIEKALASLPADNSSN